MSKRAVKLKPINNMPERNDAYLFHVEPAIQGHEYVISSAANLDHVNAIDFRVNLDSTKSVETYVFPANKKGQITDWRELGISLNGVYDVEEPLKNAGYEVVSDPSTSELTLHQL